MTKAKYRILVIFLAFLQGLYSFYPWGIHLSEREEDLLTLTGLGSMSSIDLSIILSVCLTVFFYFTYVGLFFFKRWARLSLLLFLVSGGIFILGYGAMIGFGPESLTAYFLSLLEGGVLALSYYSRAADYFKPLE